jgi:hypothetical protein
MGPQTEPSLLQSPILEGFDDDPDWFRLYVLRCRLFLLKIQIYRFPGTCTARSHKQACREHDTDAQSSPCLFHDTILLAIGRPTVVADPVYPSWRSETNTEAGRMLKKSASSPEG